MKDKIPEIKVLLGGKKDGPDAELLRRANAQFDNWVQLHAFEARKKKVQFDQLVEAGFTPEQAIALIK